MSERSSERAAPALAYSPPAERSPLLGPQAFYALAFLNAVLILGFWWAATGSQPLHGPADALNAAGRVTALLGTYLVLWQLVLMARVPLLEDAFGMERLAVLHRQNAYLAVGLLVLHGILQTAGYQLADGYSTLHQLQDFVDHYPGLLPAIAALLLMVAVFLASIATARRRLRYETWYFLHLYTYLAVALAFAHELATGTDFIANPLFVAYWWVLYIAVVAAILGCRVALPLLRYDRHHFRVQRVVREAAGITSIYIAGRDLAAFRYRAGQFGIWRFLDRKRWWEAHPFTISTAPNGRQLRLTVRAIGDFTSRLQQLKPGTRVLLEGPFGHFTRRASRHRKVLLLAGGIGITPIRALAEEMAAMRFDVVLVYRCHKEGEIAFHDELDALAEKGVRVEYQVGEKPSARVGTRDSWLGQQNLFRYAPDLTDREIYVCGPPEMTRRLQETLAQLGLEHNLHREAFRF